MVFSLYLFRLSSLNGNHSTVLEEYVEFFPFPRDDFERENHVFGDCLKVYFKNVFLKY